MNTVGLPSCPKGNSQSYNLIVQLNGTPVDITGYMFTFIANQNLDGQIAPPVVLTWTQQTPAPNGETTFLIPASVTSVLTPGGYYFNLDMMDLVGNITTIMAGTWPITPVPGLSNAPVTPGQPPISPAPTPPQPTTIMYTTDYVLGAGQTNPKEVDRAMWADASPANMNTSVYDPDKDGIVDKAQSVPWAGITGTPTTFPPDVTAELVAHKGQPSGYAALDTTGKVPAAQLQAYLLEAPTDGQIYARQNAAWVVGGLLNYSTTEQFTGRTWIDGKKIYETTINIGALPNNATVNFLHNIPNISYIIKLDFIAYSSTSGIWFQLPYGDPTAGDAIGAYASLTQIFIVTGIDRTSYNQNYCTLRYTCTNR